MLQSERQDIKQKFDYERQRWEDMYHQTDYQSKGFQWRKNGAVELCQAHLPLGSYIIDLGCGCGHASTTLAQLGYRVSGVDISEPMITQATTNARIMGLDKCQFDVFDFVNDNSRAGQFNGLVALGFIEYFDDPVLALQKMHKLLNQNGVAMVQIWNRRPMGDLVMAPLYYCCSSIAHPLRFLKRVAKSVLPNVLVNRLAKNSPTPRSRGDVKHRRYTPGELRKIAEKAGFKVIDARASRFFPSKFFFSDGLRVRWDEGLQKWSKEKPVMQYLAIDYVAALKKV